MTVMMVGSSHQGSATLTLMQAMTGTTADRAISWIGDIALVSIPDEDPEPPVRVKDVPEIVPPRTQAPAVEQHVDVAAAMTAEGEDSRRRSASEVRRLLHVTATRLMQSQLRQEQPDATASGDDSIYTHSQEHGSRTDASGRSRI